MEMEVESRNNFGAAFDALNSGKKNGIMFSVNGKVCTCTIDNCWFKAKRDDDEFICYARGVAGSKLYDLLRASIIYRR